MNTVNVGLTILIYTSVFVIFIVAGFLIKLLYDLSELTKSAKSASDLIQTELEPTLKELKETASSIKSIASTADSNFSGLKDAMSKVMEKSSFVGGKLKDVFCGILKGINFGLKLFRKNKK